MLVIRSFPNKVAAEAFAQSLNIPEQSQKKGRGGRFNPATVALEVLLNFDTGVYYLAVDDVRFPGIAAQLRVQL